MAEYLDRGRVQRRRPCPPAQIATAVGTSDATVVRTAKSLGYQSLRRASPGRLADDTDDTDLSARLSATIGGSPSAHDVLAAAADRQLEALDTLLRRVSAADFDKRRRHPR